MDDLPVKVTSRKTFKNWEDALRWAKKSRIDVWKIEKVTKKGEFIKFEKLW